MKRIIKYQSKITDQKLLDNLSNLYRFYLNENLINDIEEKELVRFSYNFFLQKEYFPTEIEIKNELDISLNDTDLLQSQGEFSEFMLRIDSNIRENQYRQCCLRASAEKDIGLRLEWLKKASRILKYKRDIVQDIKTIKDIDIKEVLKRNKSNGAGLITGISSLDNVIEGIGKGRMFTIFAAPGNFKSTIAYSMTFYNIYFLGYIGVFWSFEISKLEVYINILTIYAFVTDRENVINFKEVKNLNYTEETIKKVDIMWKQMLKEAKGNMVVLDQTDCPAMDTLSLSNFLDNLYNAFPFDFIVWDYIQRLRHHVVKGYDIKEVMNIVVSTLSEKMNNIGKDKDKMTVIMLSQANREGKKSADRNEGKYTMMDTAEVNALERDSYYLLSLWSDEESKFNKELKYCLVKHRGGITIEEPTSAYVDPKNFIVGDIYLDGYDTIVSTSSFDDLVGIEDDANQDVF